MPVEMPDLTPEQEMELCRRIADRGDLQLLGLPVGTLGEIYKIVNEWRAKGYQADAVERLTKELRIRNTLEEIVADAELTNHNSDGDEITGCRWCDTPWGHQDDCPIKRIEEVIA